MVKCLRKGGWGGGGGGQAGRVGMIRRLLKRLDQVVPVLRIYGPQRAFAYALKDRRRDAESAGGGGVLLKVLSGPSKHITNTARHTDLSQSPNTSSKSRFLFTKSSVYTALCIYWLKRWHEKPHTNNPMFPRKTTLGGIGINTTSMLSRSIFSNPLPLLRKKMRLFSD